MAFSFLELLFPSKCIFCGKLLTNGEAERCAECEKTVQEAGKGNFPVKFVAGWTCVWYYKDTVRQSLLRYKFSHARYLARPYGRALALKLQQMELTDFDVLTYVPVSRARRRKRGYDQSALLARAVAAELGCKCSCCLVKTQNNPPQSGIGDVSQRRANVSGVYQLHPKASLAHKRVLLLDDIITTGATLSECARLLLLAGAEDVRCAAVAVAPKEQ